MPITPRILLTSGEPAGIGPDIIIDVLTKHAFSAELIVIGDPLLFAERGKQLGLIFESKPIDFSLPPEEHRPGTLKFLPRTLNAPCQPGLLTVANSPYVLSCLNIATSLCLKKQAQAMVTAPIQKNILNEAGIPFSGHTEFLAEQCHVADVLMLFAVKLPSTKMIYVALATTHLPLNAVASAITTEQLIKSIILLHQELKNKFGIKNPLILVSGLNPHAGEFGCLGREEIDIIQPALSLLKEKGIQVKGPLPADTLFTETSLAEADAIFGMYHDQVLPVVKYIGFNNAVNVTLGLPIIRTSVDHGTALTLSGTGLADSGSMLEAILLSLQLALRDLSWQH